MGVVIEEVESTVNVHSTDGLWVSPLTVVPYGATSGALDAGDAVGDMVLFSVDIEGARPLPRRGRITMIKMIDLDDDVLSATLNVFSSGFVAAASDAAFTIADGDAVNCVASELFDAGTDIGASKVHFIKNVNVDYFSERGLWAQLSTSGTPTIVAADMPRVQIFVLPLE